MLSVVLAILMGIGFTFIALQNPSEVSIYLFGTVLELPLYLLAAISFLAGVFVALVFQLFDAFATSLNITRQNTETKRVAIINETLRNQVNKLSIENKKLQTILNNRNENLSHQENEHKKNEIRGFFNRVREGLT